MKKYIPNLLKQIESITRKSNEIYIFYIRSDSKDYHEKDSKKILP